MKPGGTSQGPLDEKPAVKKPRQHIPSVVGQSHHSPYGSEMESVCRQTSERHHFSPPASAS